MTTAPGLCEPPLRASELPAGRLDRLRDGTPVRIRSAAPADRPAVAEFLTHLSRDALERRFFTAIRPETVAEEILTPRPTYERVSLLVETLDSRHSAVIAHGEYSRLASDPTRAEVAFLVADDHQGLGAATLLLMHLARQAREAGIRHLDAVVLPENRAMLDVFLGSGFPCRITWQEGEGRISLDVAHDPPTALMIPRSGRPQNRLMA